MAQRKENKKKQEHILKKIAAFVCELFNTPSVQQPQVQVPPVVIGWNGYRLRPEVIEEAFQKLEKYWQVVYFENLLTPTPNLVHYRFRVYDFIPSEMSRRHLLSRVKTIAEKALTDHLHSLGIYMPVDDFIAVNLCSDLLVVAIATTQEGFSEIAKLRNQVH